MKLKIDEYTGAVGVVRGKSFLSNSIIFFERLRDRPTWNPLRLGDAYASHIFLCLNKDEIIETHLSHGIKKKPLSIYKDDDTVKIYKNVFLTEEQKKNILGLSSHLYGGKYGVLKIPLMLLDGIFRTYFFSRCLGFTNFKVCSSLIGWIYKKTPFEKVSYNELFKIVHGDDLKKIKLLDYTFGCHWKTLNPDKLHDWVVNNNKHWVELRKDWRINES